MTKFKICGLRSLEHLIISAQSGASYLGLVFVPGVRRRIQAEHAAKMISDFKTQFKSHAPKIVGLFADQPLDEVNQIIHKCKLDFAQLCGSESITYCDNVDARIIKMFKINDKTFDEKQLGFLLSELESYIIKDHIPLLDKYERGKLGGTGNTFDWSIASRLSNCYPLILAGGLTPKNVRQAILEVKPWGVDVSSGVETNGQKDNDKIISFARAAQQGT